MLTRELIYDIVTGRVTWKEFQAIETTIEDRRLLYDMIMTIYNNIDFYNNTSEFPTIGHIKKLYVDTSTNASYIWHDGQYHITNSEAINNLKDYIDNNFLSFTFPQTITDEQKALIANSIGATKSTINLTYDELVELRNNDNLVAGQYYRIIDFVTIIQDPWESIYGEETVKSAGHSFDIIVHALSNNVLSENAEADISSTDNSNHFQHCKINAWKLKYCLDNDVNRFAWANPVEGKGIIYELIDEWNNSCPYDFKNIMYKRYAIIDDSSLQFAQSLNGEYLGCVGNTPVGIILDQDFIWAYTFTHFSINSDIPEDYSVIPHVIGPDMHAIQGLCNDNIIEPCRVTINEDDAIVWTCQDLNDITLISREGVYEVSSYSDFDGNYFSARCRHIAATSGFYGNKLGHDIMNVIAGNSCSHNVFGNRVSNLVFGFNFFDNIIDSDVHNSIFGYSISNISIGSYCYRIQIKGLVQGIKIGAQCQNIIFYDNIMAVTIDSVCSNITIHPHMSGGFIHSFVDYVIIYSSTSTTSKYAMGYQILAKTQGLSSDPLYIDFDANINGSIQFAGKNNLGNLVIWNPADLVQ